MLLLFIFAYMAFFLKYFEIDSIQHRDMLVWESELVTNWDKMRIKDHFFDDYNKKLSRSKRPITWFQNVVNAEITKKDEEKDDSVKTE